MNSLDLTYDCAVLLEDSHINWIWYYPALYHAETETFTIMEIDKYRLHKWETEVFPQDTLCGSLETFTDLGRMFTVHGRSLTDLKRFKVVEV